MSNVTLEIAGSVQMKRFTTTEWTAANPVLKAGELGMDLTLGKAKLGDGTTAWLSLGFSVPSATDLTDLTDGGATALHTHAANGVTGTAVVVTTLAALATGIIKNTTTSGALSIAAGTDLPDHTHAAGQGANIAASSVTGTASVVGHTHTEDAIQVSATDVVVGRATGGAGACEELACTAAGRALLDDANATAQRATLGLGAAAVLADPIPQANGGTGATSLAAAGIQPAIPLSAAYTPINWTGKTGDVADASILATSHTAGFYRLSVYYRCTVAGSAGSLTTLSVTFSDGAATTSLVPCSYNSAITSTLLMTGTWHIYLGGLVFYSAGSAAITLKASGGTYNGSPQYTVRARLEYVGA